MPRRTGAHPPGATACETGNLHRRSAGTARAAMPGCPACLAPSVDSNYLVYDGMCWVQRDDSRYASAWYNGPIRTL